MPRPPSSSPARGSVPPDDDPARLERMARAQGGAIRPAPRSGDVVDPRARATPGAGRAGSCGTGCGCSVRAGDVDELHEGPTDADIERFSSVTQTCPHCGKELFDDADVCYHCGLAIHKGQTPPRLVPIVVTVVVLIAALVVATLAGVF